MGPKTWFSGVPRKMWKPIKFDFSGGPKNDSLFGKKRVKKWVQKNAKNISDSASNPIRFLTKTCLKMGPKMDPILDPSKNPTPKVVPLPPYPRFWGVNFKYASPMVIIFEKKVSRPTCISSVFWQFSLFAKMEKTVSKKRGL